MTGDLPVLLGVMTGTNYSTTWEQRFDFYVFRTYMDGPFAYLTTCLFHHIHLEHILSGQDRSDQRGTDRNRTDQTLDQLKQEHGVKSQDTNTNTKDTQTEWKATVNMVSWWTMTSADDWGFLLVKYFINQTFYPWDKSTTCTQPLIGYFQSWGGFYEFR